MYSVIWLGRASGTHLGKRLGEGRGGWRWVGEGVGSEKGWVEKGLRGVGVGKGGIQTKTCACQLEPILYI